MSKLSHEKREQFVFRFSTAVSIILLVVVSVFVGLQTYVRWTLNQNFTFLGGNELEALTISAVALLIVITYINRPGEKGE